MDKIIKKLASVFFWVLLVSLTFVATAAPAHAAYQAEFANSGATGGGPRVNFGTTENPTAYMIVGAYDNINNIDTKNRVLKIYSGSNDNPITVQITQLPDASTAPSSANLETLVIDKNTGKLYIGY